MNIQNSPTYPLSLFDSLSHTIAQKHTRVHSYFISSATSKILQAGQHEAGATNTAHSPAVWLIISKEVFFYTKSICYE